MNIEIEIKLRNPQMSYQEKIAMLVEENERLTKKLIRRGIELDALCGEIERLKADNAVLREQVEFYDFEEDTVEESIATYMAGNLISVLDLLSGGN